MKRNLQGGFIEARLSYLRLKPVVREVAELLNTLPEDRLSYFCAIIRAEHERVAKKIPYGKVIPFPTRLFVLAFLPPGIFGQ